MRLFQSHKAQIDIVMHVEHLWANTLRPKKAFLVLIPLLNLNCKSLISVSSVLTIIQWMIFKNTSRVWLIKAMVLWSKHIRIDVFEDHYKARLETLLWIFTSLVNQIKELNQYIYQIFFKQLFSSKSTSFGLTALSFFVFLLT